MKLRHFEHMNTRNCFNPRTPSITESCRTVYNARSLSSDEYRYMNIRLREESEKHTMAKKAKAIVIDPKLCKGCHICISVCPHGVLKKTEVVDNRGFFLPQVVDLEACKVCKLCEMECPDAAIAVAEIDE